MASKDALYSEMIEVLSRIRDGLDVDYKKYAKSLSHVLNIGAIEKAIHGANIGLSPQSDGKVVRISVPAMNEERRKEMVKVVHKKSEDARIVVRNVRRDCLDALRKLQHDKDITDDHERGAQARLQKITDRHIAEVDKHGYAKEQELLEV